MKKRISLLIICMLVFTSFAAFADSKSKKIDAWFYGIKVIINGQTLSSPLEPFIYNNNTYVPLRPIVEGMGGTPTWDDASKTITIKSSSSSELANAKNEVSVLNAQLNTANSQLKAKEDRIKELEDKIKKLEDDDDDDDDALDDLEKDIEDDYDSHTNKSKKMKFTYSFDKSSSTVEVEMKGDFEKADDIWKDRDADDFREFVKDMMEEIHKDKDFDDCDIEVIVKDEDGKKILEYNYDESKNKYSYEEY